MIKKFGDLTLREIASMWNTVGECKIGCCPFVQEDRLDLCGDFPECPINMMYNMAGDFDVEVIIDEPSDTIQG